MRDEPKPLSPEEEGWWRSNRYGGPEESPISWAELAPRVFATLDAERAALRSVQKREKEAREEVEQLRGLVATGFSEREAAEIAMRYQRECMDAAQCRIPGPPDLPGVIRVVREARPARLAPQEPSP